LLKAEFVLGEQATPEGDAMNGSNVYRAKAFELLSLAESVNDPERRADTLRFARHWMSLSEPMPNLPSTYEFSQLSG
jgi:hypothetical protein